MCKEPGERREFLPALVAVLHNLGAHIFLESGYGAGMGFSEEDYRQLVPTIQFCSQADAYSQPCVLVLRSPDENELTLMQPGSCLISMLHFPTRPQRVALLRALEVEAISMDSIKDDSGRRLIENLRAVAWNGVEAGMETLGKIYPQPGFESPHRSPIWVTLLGAGAVGSHVVQAAIRYGDEALRLRLASEGVPGVQVTVVDFDLANRESWMLELLSKTDLLIDATQRPDPTQPVIPNDWIKWMPPHAVLLDLSVDPYHCDTEPFYVKGIEGIPQGNLDQYIFTPDDPAYDKIPQCIQKIHRRHAVSCYSWPGIYPKQCMEVYGRQLQPILRTLIQKEGVQNIDPNGKFFERAIARAQLSRWPGK